MTVLTLALILGSISVASAASGKVRLTDIADNANEEAIQVTYDLEIVTGTPEGAYEPDKAINRAEFAALISRALKVPDSALASYTSTTFKDTSGYGWAVPYLAYCQQKGIMKGDGYGNAMPGRTISPNEAVTMILRAIGYTDNASVLVGQWPANYVALGQNHNLYANVSNDTEMNKASAAQMVYNGLTVQLVQVDANSLVTLLYDSDTAGFAKTLLTTYLNCYQDPAGADADGKKIVSYADTKASKINLIPKVGAYGILYRSKADHEAVALTEVETVFLTGKFSYIDDVANPGNLLGKVDKFSAVDGTKYNLSTDAKNVVDKIASLPGISVNTLYGTFMNGNDGSAVSTYVTRYKGNMLTSADVTAYRALDNDGDGFPDNKNPSGNASKVIIAARVSGVTILDLRSVAVWEADGGIGDTFLYESGQIDGKRFNGHDFPLDVNNEVDNYGYALAGVNSLDEIATDNVVYIYKNSDKKIARIEVGTETQSGAITNINESDGLRTIGGKVLTDSPYKHSGTWNDLLYINNEGTALLDVYGRTYAFRLGDASKGNFAVYLADQDSFSALQSKLFDKTGTEVIYTLKNPVVLNNISTVTTGITTLGIGTNVLVEYKLSGGKVGELRTGNYVNPGKNGHVNPSGTILTVKGSGGLNGDYLLDSNTLVYVRDGSVYGIGSIKDLLDKDIEQDFWFIADAVKTNVVRALIVDTKDAGAQNLFVMVNTVTKGSDNAGGEVDVVNGLSFADGRNAGGKSWSYLDMTLRGASGLNTTGRYAEPVKFRIGEDGILKSFSVLSADVLYLDSATGITTNPTITGAALFSVDDFITPGSGGTFTLRLNATVTTKSIASWYSINNPGTALNYVTFEANTVLYKKDGPNWTAMAPTEGNFKNDEGNGVYAFYKSDPKKAYDIIIKLN
jgi:hypothetical protein